MESVPPVATCVSPERLVRVLSTSVSLERTAMVRRVSSVPVDVWRSLFATGVSLTQVTVIVPVAVLDDRGQKVSVVW